MKELSIAPLFEDLIQVYIETNIWDTPKNEGASPSQIEAFEGRVQKQFSKSFKTYLSFFGNGLPFRGLSTFSFRSIEIAVEEAFEDEYFDTHNTIKLKSNAIERECALDEICFVDYSDTSGYFTAILLEEEYLMLYSSYCFEEGFGGHRSLAYYCRNVLYTDLSLINSTKKYIDNFEEVPLHLESHIPRAKNFDLAVYPWLKALFHSKHSSNEWLAFHGKVQWMEVAQHQVFTFSEVCKMFLSERA